MSNIKKIMIVAGEPSGDGHAAKLVQALKESMPDVDPEFFGAAGPQMRQCGVEATVDSDGFAIIGLPEIGRALPMFWRAFAKLKNEARERKPDVAVLVDFPEFNLKLAKALKKQGITVVYYISPQLWAWRKYRIRTIRKYVDLLISILPFEKAWYAERGVENVEYVGSPLAKEVHSSISKDDFCLKHGLDKERPIVALLPGSRHKEITYILPEMLKTGAAMADKNADIQFVVALAANRKIAEVEQAIADAKRTGVPLPQTLLVIQGETYDVLNAADAAAVASGTATLETGIIGTPMVIVYKGSSLNYKLLRPLITVEHFGLINLIAGYRLATELIQDDLTPQNLSAELFKLLQPEENSRVRSELKNAADKLGHGGASHRAAEQIKHLLQQ